MRTLIAAVAFVCVGFAAAPGQAADPNKILRLAFNVAETAFDPVAVSDLYSGTILEAVLDPMLAYDYLARPVKLVPNTLVAMPEISDNATSYVFRVRQGIYFTADPAFKGKRRELTAADYAYSIKRLFDPRLKSPWLFLLDGKLAGLNEAREKAKLSEDRFDYDAPLAGLEVIDRYTLKVRLKQPDYNLLYIFAMPTLGALAREVVEFYGDDIGSHPVGTGPYQLKEWVRSHKIVLEANPDYRETYFAAQLGKDPRDREIAELLQSKRLPLIGRVEVTIIEESQPLWLAFLNGELDFTNIPPEFTNLAIPSNKLAPNLAKRGIKHDQSPEPDVTYTFFNMEDAVVGGYTKEKVALRRAVSLAYDTAQEIKILRKGQAIAAQSPIAPEVAGYDPDLRTQLTEYNPAKAKALLDIYGYKDRDADGYRELPDGKPLTLEYASTPDSLNRQFDELWKKNMDAIGIRMTFKKAKWPELVKESRAGKLQMHGAAWHADYPDAENFLQLLYGPNAGEANNARFKLKQYDLLYEKVKNMPDSPQRTALYREMAKLVLVYAPWKLGVHRIANTLIHPWLRGYKRHPLIHAPWRYLDIDLSRRHAER
jgi:ABC-type transport system substrate-binding protein